MRKKKISFEQLAVLSFYRFGKLDGIDMTLLMEMCSDVIDVDISRDSDIYSLIDNGIINLDDIYVKDFEKNVDGELFEGLFISGIYKYIDNIDMFEFMLRKIKLCGSINVNILEKCSLYQISIIQLLCQMGYVRNFDDEKDRVVKLTKRGDHYLFLIDYKSEIDKFKTLLFEHGYMSLLVDAFLITQDLSMDIREILLLDKFIEFVENYDMAYEVNNKYMKGNWKVKKLC